MSPSTNPASRLRFFGAAVLLATFAVGALSGTAVSEMKERRTAAVAPAANEACKDENSGRHKSMLDDLGLTAEQQERVDAILADRKRQLDLFWNENRPRMEQIVDSTRAEIRAVLTSEQRAELDRRRAERRARREAKERADSAAARP